MASIYWSNDLWTLSFIYFFEFNIKAIIYSTSEPYVTEEELKLMLRGAELSGAIEEEEQVMNIGFNSNNIMIYLFSKCSALSLIFRK